jgi:hypothetical protein
MSALLDLWHSVMGIVTSGDYVTLGIIVVIALAIGFVMQEFSSLITATIGALAIFVIAIYVRALVSVKGAGASALAQSDWHNLLGVTFHTVLAYAITFAIVITAVRLVRSLINR